MTHKLSHLSPSQTTVSSAGQPTEMSSEGDVGVDQDPDTVGSSSVSSTESDVTSGSVITVTIGATVPTGFEHTAAEEVQEKIGVDARISKDRGRIYFPISTDRLFQVRCESQLEVSLMSNSIVYMTNFAIVC